MGRNIGKNISKSLSSIYSQKRIDHAKQSATDAFQKTVEATGDLIGNKIADKFTKVSNTSPKNNLETNKEEILRERFIPAVLGHKIIDDLRLKEENY